MARGKRVDTSQPDSENTIAPTTKEDENQDVVRIPLYTTVNAPKISDFECVKLLKWREDRTEYENILEARIKCTREDLNSIKVSVKDSFDIRLLTTLAKYQWGKELTQITDEFLLEEIERAIRNDGIRVQMDIPKFFKQHLKLDLNKKDVRARIINYFALFDQLIMENQLSHWLNNPAKEAEKCTLLVESLRPKELYREVKQRLTYENDTARSNLQELFAVITNVRM